MAYLFNDDKSKARVYIAEKETINTVSANAFGTVSFTVSDFNNLVTVNDFNDAIILSCEQIDGNRRYGVASAPPTANNPNYQRTAPSYVLPSDGSTIAVYVCNSGSGQTARKIKARLVIMV